MSSFLWSLLFISIWSIWYLFRGHETPQDKLNREIRKGEALLNPNSIYAKYMDYVIFGGSIWIADHIPQKIKNIFPEGIRVFIYVIFFICWCYLFLLGPLILTFYIIYIALFT